MSERWSDPLVVELDGPLNKADWLTEGIVTMLLRRPTDLPGVLAAVPTARVAFEIIKVSAVGPRTAIQAARKPVIVWLCRAADALVRESGADLQP